MRTGRTAALLLSSAAALAALATPAGAQQAAAVAAAPQAEDTGSAPLEQTADVVVTAQRRTQTLFEVPQSISVVGGEVLERQQARSFQDYAALIPGFSITETNPGTTRLILRGINTGSVASTVAVYADDVPFGSSGSLANGGIHAGDFDTFDIARIEVLKGPQGTLYGSNALGGVLKFITAEPGFDRIEARGQAGIEDTAGGGTGYFGNALFNLPLGDTLALRASGFFRRTAGYIDTTGRPGRNVNDADSYGGRATLLFKPTDALSIRLFGLYQNLDVDSDSTFDADPVTLRPVDAATRRRQSAQTRFELYPDANPSKYRLVSGTLGWDAGFASLTSVTSYSESRNNIINDISTNAARPLTGLVPEYVAAAGGAANLGLGFENNVQVKKFTQEVRLASPDDQVFEWLVGGYYTHEDTALQQRYFPFRISDRTLVPPAGSLPALGVPSFREFVEAEITAKYEELAAFASGTLHLGPRFDVTVGGRYSHNEQSSEQAVLQFGSGPTTVGESSEGVFTWSVAPRFELSDRVSVYARAAKGYRPGGPTFIPAGAPADYPTKFNSDTLVSYEAGVRGETADRTFSIDASAFLIDWKDILIIAQVPTSAGPATVNTNGRRARSYGGDVTATLRPTAGLSVVASAAYNHARLRDDTTPRTGGANITGGLAGDRLPYSPNLTASLSADYEWSLSDDATAYVGGDVRVVGDQAGSFSANYRTTYGRVIEVDGYQTVDLRAGVNLGGFTLSAYARNLTNEYGITSAGYSNPPLSVPAALGGAGLPLARVSTIRPRTIGASVGVRF
jgi:iron complex outermembrane recepter protein